MNNYEFVSNRILKKLDFLIRLGYQIKEMNFKYKALEINTHEDLKIIFENLQIGRKISLLYIPINNDGVNIEVLGIQIWNVKKGGIFSIHDFMQLKLKDNYKELSLRSFDGPYEDRLDQLLDYVVNIMQKYLMDVLEGKKWINVPMDWGGAK